jgi:hypothetical protein
VRIGIRMSSGERSIRLRIGQQQSVSEMSWMEGRIEHANGAVQREKLERHFANANSGEHPRAAVGRHIQSEGGFTEGGQKSEQIVVSTLTPRSADIDFGAE